VDVAQPCSRSNADAVSVQTRRRSVGHGLGAAISVLSRVELAAVALCIRERDERVGQLERVAVACECQGLAGLGLSVLRAALVAVQADEARVRKGALQVAAGRIGGAFEGGFGLDLAAQLVLQPAELE
jgi:hypothetical protein